MLPRPPNETRVKDYARPAADNILREALTVLREITNRHRRAAREAGVRAPFVDISGIFSLEKTFRLLKQVDWCEVISNVIYTWSKKTARRDIYEQSINCFYKLCFLRLFPFLIV